MDRIKAVIFDLDGTLADSLEDIADAINEMLANCDYPTHDYRSYKYMVGNGFRKLVGRSMPEDVLEDENVARCHKIAMDYYRQNFMRKTRLYSGIGDLLDFLAERGVKMAVLSNKPDELTGKMVDKLMSRWHFDVVMGAGEDFPRKPDPVSALFIADEMGVRPQDVVFVGDSNVDMQTAAAAGFIPVGVSWGFRPRMELEEAGARFIADNPTQLKDFLAPLI